MVYWPSVKLDPLGSAVLPEVQAPVLALKLAANVVSVALQPVLGFQYLPSLWRYSSNLTNPTPLPPGLSDAVPLITCKLLRIWPEVGVVNLGILGGVVSTV